MKRGQQTVGPIDGNDSQLESTVLQAQMRPVDVWTGAIYVDAISLMPRRSAVQVRRAMSATLKRCLHYDTSTAYMYHSVLLLLFSF